MMTKCVHYDKHGPRSDPEAHGEESIKKASLMKNTCGIISAEYTRMPEKAEVIQITYFPKIRFEFLTKRSV